MTESPRIQQDLLLAGLRLILRPIIKFCLRHSLRLQDLNECAKVVFIDVATRQLNDQGKKSPSIKVNLMTGVHRKDIARIKRNEPVPESYKDLVTKVLGLWQSNQKFLTRDGHPRVLSVDGDRSEFEQLVFSVSRELSPQAILDELERVKAVSRSKTGVKLEVGSYVPSGDPKAGLELLQLDSSDLIRAVEENVLFNANPPNYHARTEYDNIRPSAISALRNWFLKEGHQFHARAREFMSQFDQDIRPDPEFKGQSVRIVLSGFSLIDEKKNKNV